MAQEPERELGYAVLAGYKLAADYANSEALSFLNRAIHLTDDSQTEFELLVLRREIHKRIGDRRSQEDDLQRLQALVRRTDDYERQAEVGNIWADYYQNISEYSAAMVALRYAHNASKHAGDQASEAKSMTIQGQVLEHKGAYREAREHFERALALCRQLGDHSGEADNLNRISNVCRYLGDIHTAQTYAVEALRIRRNIGDRAKEALSLYNLGLIELELGESDAASAYRQQALEIAQSIGDRASEALSLSAIGQGSLVKGDYASAQRFLQQALRLYQVMGERRSEANCLNLLGMVWRDVGNDRNAQRSFEQAIAIQEKIGSLSFAAYSYLNLGLVNLHLNTPMAQFCYQKALESARETGNRDAEAYALSYIAGLHEHERHWDEALRDYRRALDIREDLHASAAAFEDTAGLARAHLAKGDMEQARELVSTCLGYVNRKGVEGMEFPMQVYLTCYDVLQAAGDVVEANRVIEDAHELLVGRADAISDPIMRDGMLHNVPINQRVLAEWYGRLGEVQISPP
jgi:tetratricopeptide (TPR) repeat protein